MDVWKRDSEVDEVPPDASAMIESLRAYGYTIGAAVADLVDNSIAAGARRVWIDAVWRGADSWLAVTDDGHGMDEDELRNAMRLGSKHPLDPRDRTDLGRFGMGLKTASLSQCRRLTVYSKPKGGAIGVRRWDLEHLARGRGWELLRSPHPSSAFRPERLESLDSGTSVVWEVMDRVVRNAAEHDEAMRSHFLRQMEEVAGHLAMVFHRFLDAGPRRLHIFVNETRVEPWDPFMEGHPATQAFPEEGLAIPGVEGHVAVKGYVLPHKDRLTDEEHRRGAGPGGWNARQGFYVYRNRRLIVAGSWLGLGPRRGWTKEEHYKLARIRLDIPNSMDHLWELDVKKSTATPPVEIRDRLREIANRVRQEARRVFAHRGRRGRRLTGEAPKRPWLAGTKGERRVYRINREHPLVAAVLRESGGELKKKILAMLRVIEETVPVQLVWLDMAEREGAIGVPFAGASEQERRRLLTITYASLRGAGHDHRSALAELRSLEEFSGEEWQALISAMWEGDDAHA